MKAATGLLSSVFLILFFSGCQQSTTSSDEFAALLRDDITLCGSSSGLSSSYLTLFGFDEITGKFGEPLHPRLLGPGLVSGLPRIAPNDNRTPAGTLVKDVLELNLELVLADFRMETKERPGLRVVAIAESGKAPSVPAPLIRVETGTRIRVRISNTLKDSAITVFGFQKRPAAVADSVVIEPGDVKTVLFESGEPGTYLYWIRMGSGFPVVVGGLSPGEEEQMAGALVIDPKGGSAPDRIFVMNVFHTPIDTALHPWGSLEALTINGLSWPFTERIKPNVGDTLRWRVVNASTREHPMHLHGFYYDVLARGTMLQDESLNRQNRRTVVTENMKGRSTMDMQWVVRRPGKWLFHCHLSFHVTKDVRLPGASAFDNRNREIHMSGLVLGIEVPPGPSDLITTGGEAVKLTLQANQYGSDSDAKYRFSLTPQFPKSKLSPRPGPLLLLKQYQETYVTVDNQMSIPTGVHWHGLELDSWSDGVPGWSASDGKISPIIQPGEKFTYKLTLMRPGTFLYHSHFDDVHQLTAGLYGPLIVMGVDDIYDPETDHFYIVGWNTPNPRGLKDIELNGRTEQPLQRAAIGETHRIRVLNMAPAGDIVVHMHKADQPVPLRFIAKDGAELSEHQQVDLEVSAEMGVGETADFTFTPTASGKYDLQVGYPGFEWHQQWEVAAK